MLDPVPRLADTGSVPPTPLTRRRLLRDGATGTAALYLATRWEVLDTAAIGAPISPVVRRSTWTALVGQDVAAGGRSLRVVEVVDLPVATQIAELRGHDGAFVVRLSGAPGLAAETHGVSGPGGLSADLFLAPTDAASTPQIYEAVVDRTIRIAGINDEGAPEPVPAPAVRTGAAAVPGGARTLVVRTPRLRAAKVHRRSARRAAVELRLSNTRDVATVRVSLLQGRRAVARASTQRSTPHDVRLSLVGRDDLKPGRYRLVVRLVTKDGAVTTVRRSVRLGSA